MLMVRRRLVALILLATTSVAQAEGPKLGLVIEIEGDGFILNPLVTKINVTGVQAGSIAAAAGLVVGDEIMSIEGKSIKGRRAYELKSFLSFGPGESRSLVVRHVDGVMYEAKLYKPKD